MSDKEKLQTVSVEIEFFWKKTIGQQAVAQNIRDK